MKKRRLLAMLLTGAMCASLAACGDSGNDANSSSSSTGGGTADGATSVGVILKTTASEYWSYVKAGAEAYAKENPNVSVEVVGASSETAYDEQQNMIETSLNSGAYDAYVIAPLQADMVATMIAGQTKPIIAVDTKIDAPEVRSFVGTGNESAAEMGGKAAVEAAKAAGWTDDQLTAIAISGVQGDSTATDRLTGYQKGIEAAGGTFLADEIQYADAVADKAANSMEAIMQNHPEGVAMIVCNNDDMAMAAARAAKGNAAYAKTVFVGFDGIQSACNAILNGEETMSVAQEAYDMGYKAVEAAVKAANGEEVEEFIDSGCSIVNKDNAQERLDTLKGYLGE